MKGQYFTPQTIEQKSRAMLRSLEKSLRLRKRQFTPGNSALLVLDMQEYFIDSSSHAYIPSVDAILPGIQALIREYHAHRLPVIFTQHIDASRNAGLMASWWRDSILPENPLSNLASCLDASAGVVIQKSQYDAFCQPALEELLHDKAASQVVIAGVMAHLCCETTARSAFVRGFEVFFLVDGTATYNERFHQATLLNLSHGFVVPVLSKDILSALKGKASPNWGMNASKKHRIEKVAIIGAGPAGLATALQLKRYGISALLLEGDHVGGLLCNANMVENYPGFPGGISGQGLVDLFWSQAKKVGVEITFKTVKELTRAGDLFQISTTSGIYQSRLVVVASGTAPLTFADAMISDEVRHRIFYEVYPLLSLESQRIAIVGAGDAAFDYALNLARKNEVIILNRGEHVKCLPLLWDRATASARIQYRAQIAASIFTRNPYNCLRLECESPSGKEIIEVDYLIGALGREPRLYFLSASLREEARELEHEGILYFVGDVHNDLYRQTAIAVGDGVRAAMQIYQYLKEFAL